MRLSIHFNNNAESRHFAGIFCNQDDSRERQFIVKGRGTRFHLSDIYKPHFGKSLCCFFLNDREINKVTRHCFSYFYIRHTALDCRSPSTALSR